MVKNDRLFHKNKLEELLFDMDTSIRKFEKDMEYKLAGTDNETSRDRVKEKVEEAKR